MLELFPVPRAQGRPKKKFQTINPAIVLASVAAFEGFAEDLIATALYADEHPMAYIASNSHLSNPTVRQLERDLIKLFDVPATAAAAGGFAVTIVAPPATNSTTNLWNTSSIRWSEILDQADDWMQVRHNLTHGLATGLEPERWSGPASRRDDAGLATRVLTPRPQASGPDKYSLNLWGAVSCARIYARAAARLAEVLAAKRNEVIDTSGVPDFSNV